MLSCERLRQIISLMLFMLVIGHGLATSGEAADGVTISVDRVKQLLGAPDTVIIDVRKPRSWWRSSKKILTAVREDPSKVDRWAAKYTKDQTLIFY
jgi:hypothetical protein